MIHLVLLGIIILFAGLTAAYLIGPDAGEEAGFRIPRIFWLSSILVLLVSLSMRRVLKAYERDNSSTLSGWLLAATITALFLLFVNGLAGRVCISRVLPFGIRRLQATCMCCPGYM